MTVKDNRQVILETVMISRSTLMHLRRSQFHMARWFDDASNPYYPRQLAEHREVIARIDDELETFHPAYFCPII